MFGNLEIKKSLFSGLTTQLYYNQPFLQGTDCNSSTFLREISYKVNLTECVNGLLPCACLSQPFSPEERVQMRLPALGLEYGGEKGFLEASLKQRYTAFTLSVTIDPIKTWGISNDYFIYKPQVGDENFDCYHITNLRNENSTLLVKDCVNDPSCNFMAYQDGILYIANQATVFLLDVKVDLAPGETRKIDLTSLQVQRVIPGLKIHGLFNHFERPSKWLKRRQIIVALETADNQLDFSQIVPKGLGTNQFSFELKQQREIVQRDIKIDPIKQFSYIIEENNIFYGIALRESGRLDIYWNMTLVDSPPHTYAKDVSVSFDTIYLRTTDDVIFGIPTSGSSISYEQGLPENEEFDFNIIFYQNIKNHGIFWTLICTVLLYTAFTLIRTTLFVSHGPFISLYNIQESQWVKHVIFKEGDIHKLIKCYSKPKSRGGEDNFDVTVILHNGQIYNDIQEDLFRDQLDDPNKLGAQTLNYMDKSRCDHFIQGEIVRTTQDQLRNEWFYIMTRENMVGIGEEPKYLVRLFVLYLNKLYEINEGLEYPLDLFTHFVHVFTNTQESYIVLQKHSEVWVYSISVQKPELLPEEEDTNLGALVEDIAVLNLKLHTNLRNVKGEIHSAMSMNIQNHIFFVDLHHFYLYNFVTKSVKIYKDQNCVGLYVVDDKFCYTLSHSSGDKSSGLRLYDLNNILTKDTDVSYMLQNVQVGLSGHIDWNQDYCRFSLLKSLDQLNIVPALHRNTIAFIGMSRRENYQATKVIKDKFIALDKKNYLFCWSVVTGKLLSVNKLPTRQDYSKFRVFCSAKDDQYNCEYKREWYQKILLVKNEPEKNFDEKAFYKGEGVYASALNQVSFSQSQVKDFREFRLIEIMSETEIKEHLVFVHPVYTKERQRLYFDVKNKYMIERLQHPRVFLYEKEENKMRGMIKWKCLRRFSKYPEELENESGYLRALSPSFQYYIDINRTDNQFVIKDTFLMEERYKIPKDLMDLDDEPAKDIMNRFKWIDDETFRLINQEGIEKIVNIRRNFEEIEFNVIPLFNNEEIKDPLRHFYSNKHPLDISQVKERLMRCYQDYKSVYYLEKKRQPSMLYPELFTVDYQVDGCKGMHVADMSFTFLHWKIMEQLENQTLQIEQIDNKQIELLCYNILPGGDTILHKLSHHGDIIKKIFMIAHPNEDNVSEIAIHIPFIQNLKHKSPMHICKEQQDIRTMETMLTYLCGYGIDHHSRAIIELIPFIIEKQLPSLLQYIDSRSQQTKKLKAITKGCLKPRSLGIIESKIWFNREEFEQRLMQQRQDGDETLIERPIRVQFIDLPRAYHYQDDLCEELFGALADTDQLEIFQQESIQKIIEYNYPLVREWTIKKLFIPFMMFQANLFIYLNFVFGHNNAVANMLDIPMQILLAIFSCYFLRNEITQMKNDGFAYLSSVWNYIDIITPTTVFTVVCIKATSIHIGEEVERIIQAIGVFFMWFKFLYFFRIFKSYAYLTRLIIVVISDMSTFLVVLFFTIVAFSDSLLTLSNGNDPEHQFVKGFGDSIIYTYRIILGDFDVSNFGHVGQPLVMALFIICTVFNTIVMLNLLIAIISESFTIVKENANNASYQEMAAMIAENAYLIPERLRHAYAQTNSYIIFVTDLESEMSDGSDEFIQRVEQLKKTIKDNSQSLTKMTQQMNSKIEKMSKTFKKVKKHLKYQQEQQDRQEANQQYIVQLLHLIPAVKENDLQTSRFENDLNQSQRLNSHIKHSFKTMLSNKFGGLGGLNTERRGMTVYKKATTGQSDSDTPMRKSTQALTRNNL